jgi:intracellular sulfur oxidation DsrE/DsrF family protein
MDKFIFTLIALASCLPSRAQSRLFPLIKGSGPVWDVPYAKEKPDPSIEYKIVGTIGDESENPKEIHPSLMHFCRMYNLHIYGGIPQTKLNVTLVMFFKATPMVLSNEAYKAKFNVDNPNLNVLKELEAAGVKLLVCSQSLEILKLNHKDVMNEIVPATSRFTVVTTHQLKGYALMEF